AACRRASWPTRRSADFVKATTDGVVRPPSAFGMTTGSPASMTAITEFVVPRSMPTVFAIFRLLECVRAPGAPRHEASWPVYTLAFSVLNEFPAALSWARVGRVSLGANAHGDRRLRAGRIEPGPAAE